MQLTLTDGEQAVRDEVRAFLGDHLPDPDEVPTALDERMAFLQDWQGQLYRAGLVGMAWPREYGGRGATLMEQIVANDELARAGAPEVVGLVSLEVVGPTIVRHGTPAQHDAYVRRMLSGEDLWCQGFSEPSAGSDLASLRTVAVDHGDHFVLNGQKTWTSWAQYARWCAVLAKTDLDAPPHRGISYLVVDMQAPGVEVRPMVQLTGDAEFSEVFLHDVVVPRENLVGELHGGWAMAMHTLSNERGPAVLGRQTKLRILLDRLILDARTVQIDGRPAAEDPLVQAALARAHVELEVLRHQSIRSVGGTIARGHPGVESSVDKLFMSVAEHRLGEAAIAVFGSQFVGGDPRATHWQRAYLYGRAASIYGGASQIQKNIIAERILGLPRSA